MNQQEKEYKAFQALDQAKQAVAERVEELKENVQATKDRMEERVEQAQEAASQKGRELLSQAQRTAEKAIQAVGAEVEKAAASIESSPLQQFAEPVRHGGRYLSRHGLADIRDDAVGYLQKSPVLTMGLGFACGVLLGALIPRRD